MASTTTDQPAAAAAAAEAANPVAKTEEPKPAPKLSEHDFRIFNQIAVRMDYFHENFRRTWNLLWSYATTGKRQNGMTLKQLVRAGLDFGEHLTAHHGIEEQHMFPVLSKRMPEFDARRGELVQQHKTIHKGLDGLQAYLEGVQRGDEALEAGALRARMESWGAVLWEHLDKEVETLGAANMARYWTKEEMMRMRW
ncbi:hypothetical protein LEL_05347 [Akanthomyces lecanii RCEF 1005]|uniref:Hemerythrin-like domain-containing protein n=1 Tax=Akanthomyces lecanii RCEF 1005 TaxID=1081108 RepID=A0A168HZK8_CORDF|nr:hypothetical protein LEL_05347 [Akanthomyces lecanii RCEF 1005]